MNNKKHFRRNSSNQKRKRKPHPKTTMSSWNRVANEASECNYDKDEMSRRYKKYKRQDTFIEIIKSIIPTNKPKQTSPKQCKNTKTSQKYIPKKTILDDLREHRSSKTISAISNSFAQFIIKGTAQDLNNSQKNAIRSIVAFATSEALSKAFEKELDVLEKVKTFIKIGQTVYKVVLWYDEHSNSYKTDSKNIKQISVHSLEYTRFLINHPIVKEVYENRTCLSKEDFNSGKKCMIKQRLEQYGYIVHATESQTPNSCPFYYYCNK